MNRYVINPVDNKQYYRIKTDFIYNRFDLQKSNDNEKAKVDLWCYSSSSDTLYFETLTNKTSLVIGTWYMNISELVLYRIVKKLFSYYRV